MYLVCVGTHICGKYSHSVHMEVRVQLTAPVIAFVTQNQGIKLRRSELAASALSHGALKRKKKIQPPLFLYHNYLLTSCAWVQGDLASPHLWCRFPQVTPEVVHLCTQQCAEPHLHRPWVCAIFGQIISNLNMLASLEEILSLNYNDVWQGFCHNF